MKYSYTRYTIELQILDIMFEKKTSFWPFVLLNNFNGQRNRLIRNQFAKTIASVSKCKKNKETKESTYLPL